MSQFGKKIAQQHKTIELLNVFFLFSGAERDRPPNADPPIAETASIFSGAEET